MKLISAVPARISLLFMGFFLLGAASSAVAAQSGAVEAPIKVGWQDFKPMIYSEGGVTKGTYVTTRNELLAEAGLEYTDIFYPQISRLYHQLKTARAWLMHGFPACTPALRHSAYLLSRQPLPLFICSCLVLLATNHHLLKT